MKVLTWPTEEKSQGIRYVLAWNPPKGVLEEYPDLEVIFSYGAGIDHLIDDPDLPDCPIVRYVDPDLTLRMSEYVVLHTLLHHRRQTEYIEFQQKKNWKELPQPAANEVRVGVMGLGVLGRAAALALDTLGFRVAGWCRSRKHIPGIDCYVGSAELREFLGRTDILVCLLPLTEKTQGLLNRELFQGLAQDGAGPGPVLINAGRGGLQVEEDIISALDAGELYAASLDVFETEPLSISSPLWNHPRVLITPHNSSVSDARAVANYVIRQITRYERGDALENIVDLKRGY